MRRPWWKDHKEETTGKISFFWRAKPDIDFQTFNEFALEPKMYNKLEAGYEITSKDNLFRNLWYLCNVVSAQSEDLHSFVRHNASHFLIQT